MTDTRLEKQPVQMKRILACVAVAFLLLLIPSLARAQPAKPVHIGMLIVSQRSGPVLAFKEGLASFGYVEGVDFTIEYRSPKGDTKKLFMLASELVNSGVDVIVTHSTPGVRAAKKATSTIPIVMASVGNAVESGLVESYARPGGNVTGNSFFGAEISQKRLQVLREVLPSAMGMALIAHPSAPKHSKLRALSAGKSLGLDVPVHYAKGPTDFARVFAAIKRTGIRAAVILGSPIFYTHRRKLIEEAARFKLPVMYPWRDAPEEGGLMSLGPDPDELWKGAAAFVDKLIKGARPNNIPVERATKFELILNLKTARALGIQFPASVLFRAKEVIE